jgi:hypothetical protein
MPIIVAVLLALSVLGGGVVYAAENAPPSSPLRPVREVVDNTLGQVTTIVTTVTTTTTTSGTNLNSTSTVTTTLTMNGDEPGSGHSDRGDADRGDQHRPITGTAPITITFPVTNTGGITITFPIREKHEITVTNPFTGSLGITFTNVLTNVEGLDHLVPGQSDDGLLAKLRAAAEAIERGQTQVAVNILNAFAHQLDALEQSGHIRSSTYSTLYNDYASLVSQLGGTPVPTVTLKSPDPELDKHGVNTPEKADHNKGTPTPNSASSTTVGGTDVVAPPIPATTVPNHGSTKVNHQGQSQGQDTNQGTSMNSTPTNAGAIPSTSGNHPSSNGEGHGQEPPSNAGEAGSKGADHGHK